MAKSNEVSIPRREFLRGAATLVGASVVGIVPGGSALAGVLRAAAAPAMLSVGYWNGTSLTEAARLPAGDPTLERVHLELRSYGGSGDLRQIDVLPLISTPKGPTRVNFAGWSAPPEGCAKTQFQMPVDSEGLVTSIRLGSGVDAQATPCTFVTGSAGGPKLLEGTYVLVPAAVDWRAYGFDPSRADSPLTMNSNPLSSKAPIQYVVLTVTRA